MSTGASADRARGWGHRVAARALASVAVCVPAALLLASTPAFAFPQLQSQGSSFAAVAINQWVGQASSLYGFNINFQVSSSVLGLQAFGQNADDFAASDIPYSSGQSDTVPSQPYQYLPDVAGALAFMYNLVGVNGQQIRNLVLNAQTIDGIFTGKLVYWDDPSIKSINPPSVAENLPHTTIIPVIREDASGENYLLADYLLHQDGANFRSYVQAAEPSAAEPSAVWPVDQQGAPPGYPNASSFEGQNGSDGVANYVSALSSEGSIGYLETAYAIVHNFPVASLVNASGNAVQPTSLNDATALEKAILFADLTQNLTNVYSNPLPNAYPVSAYSYLVTPCSPTLAAAQSFSCAGPQGASPLTADRGAELGQFVNFLACDGQEKMALLGYSPLPPNLVQEDFNAIGRLNGGRQPSPPTPSTCHNPYVDGEVPLPGEPAIDTSVSDASSSAAQTAAATAATTAAAQAATKANQAGSSSGPAKSGTTSDGSATSPSGRTRTGTTGGVTEVRTTPLGDPYKRYNALEHVAASTPGPSLLGLLLLWLFLLAIALAGPPLGWAAWSRHRRRHPNGREGTEPGGTSDDGVLVGSSGAAIPLRPETPVLVGED